MGLVSKIRVNHVIRGQKIPKLAPMVPSTTGANTVYSGGIIGYKDSSGSVSNTVALGNKITAAASVTTAAAQASAALRTFGTLQTSKAAATRCYCLRKAIKKAKE